jgi:hypothetical protein
MTIQLVFVASPLSTQHSGERAKTGLLGSFEGRGVKYHCCIIENNLKHFSKNIFKTKNNFLT